MSISPIRWISRDRPPWTTLPTNLRAASNPCFRVAEKPKKSECSIQTSQRKDEDSFRLPLLCLQRYRRSPSTTTFEKLSKNKGSASTFSASSSLTLQHQLDSHLSMHSRTLKK